MMQKKRDKKYAGEWENEDEILRMCYNGTVPIDKQQGMAHREQEWQSRKNAELPPCMDKTDAVRLTASARLWLF